MYSMVENGTPLGISLIYGVACFIIVCLCCVCYYVLAPVPYHHDFGNYYTFYTHKPKENNNCFGKFVLNFPLKASIVNCLKLTKNFRAFSISYLINFPFFLRTFRPYSKLGLFFNGGGGGKRGSPPNISIDNWMYIGKYTESNPRDLEDPVKNAPSVAPC